MAKLRLFANLREIAGESRVDIESDTVRGVLESATSRFGPQFGRGLETAKVWINGEPAGLDATVGSSDEVVLIPPVSGGSQPSQAIAPADLVGFVPLGLALVAVLANLQGQAIWAAFAVAAIAVWAADLGASFERRRKSFAPLPVMIAAAAGVLAGHTIGSSGYGLALGVAVVATLGWAVAYEDYRDVDVFSPTLLTAVFAGLAGASMVLSRSAFSPDDRAIDVFLVAVIAAVLLGAIAIRMQQLPLLDPFSVSAIGAVLAAVGAASLWDLDVVGYLLVGLGVAIAMVAGRGLSSMLRLGTVSLTDLPPGAVASLDGVILAAAIYYPLIRIIL